MNFFVTGTDTGVGKTHTIVHLLRLLQAAGKTCAGFKPICCGDRQDAERLLQAGSPGLTIDQINPLWLKTPAAPMIAAEIEKVEIDTLRLMGAFESLRARVEQIVVEGVGGWLVPIRAKATGGRTYLVSYLAREMKLPLLVVAQTRLGCLNHTALTVESIQAHGLECAGVVLNALPDANGVAVQTNAETLRRMLGVPLVTGLTEKMTELPPDWDQLLGSTKAVRMSSE